MILGIFILLLGVMLLLKNLGLVVFPASTWALVYPLILIVLGIYIMLGIRRGKRYRDWVMEKGWKRWDKKPGDQEHIDA